MMIDADHDAGDSLSTCFKLLRALSKKVYCYPEIPTDILHNAIASYAQDTVPTSVLFVIDLSWRRNGKCGLLATSQRIYGKIPLTRPSSQPFPSTETFCVKHGRLYLGKTALSINPLPLKQSQFLCLIRQINNILLYHPTETWQTLFDRADHDGISLTEDASLLFMEKTPEIRKAAIQSFAQGIEEREILSMVDLSVWKNGQAGMLFTEKRFYMKIGGFPKKNVPLYRGDKLFLKNGDLYLNDALLFMVPAAEQAKVEQFCKQFNHHEFTVEEPCASAILGGKTKHSWCYLAPDIPPKKLDTAIREYAAEVNPEDALLLSAPTILLSAKHGILLTDSAVYCCDPLKKCVKLNHRVKATCPSRRWQPTLLQLDSTAISIPNLTQAQAMQLCRFIETISEAASAKHSPVPPEGWSHFFANTANHRIFVAPNIPTEKAAQALQSYARKIKTADLLVLIDNTYSKSAKKGCAITQNCIYYKNRDGQKGKISIEANTTIALQKKQFLLNGSLPVSLELQEEASLLKLLYALAAMVAEIKAIAP